MPHCTVIVPIYNEEASLSRTLARLKQVADEILCVNDGSKDRTGEILQQEKGIRFFTHKGRRGYGASLKTGLDHSSSEWVIIVDADGTYPIEDLPKLLAEIDNQIDMVVGVRQGIGITLNPFRRMARWILRKMVHVLTGVMVSDLNSGMRVFRRSLYQEFSHLLPMGFSFTTTLTVASLYSGYNVKHVPIAYSKRKGKSNIHPLADFFGFVMLIVRLATYFDPLRFFIPFSFVVLWLGILRAIRDIILNNAIGSLAVILFSLAIQVFVTGIIADVIVKRSLFLSKSSHDKQNH